jgi:hypothetical protein
MVLVQSIILETSAFDFLYWSPAPFIAAHSISSWEIALISVNKISQLLGTKI